MSLEFGSFYELSEIDEMDEIERGEVISEIREMTIHEFEEETEEVSEQTALWMLKIRLGLGAFHERQALVRMLARHLGITQGEAELKLREMEK